MSSRSVILTVEGLRKVGEAIEKMGGTLGDVSRATSIPASTIWTLIDRQKPVTKRNAEKVISALQIPFDESLLIEPVEYSFLEVRERERYFAQEELKNRAQQFFAAAQGTNIHNQIIVNKAAEELSEARTDDVQGIASAQLKILANYYNEGLTQAKTSFRWAAIVSGVGFVFFLAAVFFVLNRQPRDQTLIPLISGAVIEIVAGINFYLYGQATKQLAIFQKNLDQTQRFLLANSICESLEGQSKQAARVELVKTVSSLTD